jgi:hypothetical protein
MVKSAQVEPHLESQLQSLVFKGVSARVGLLIGKKAVGSRDLLLAVIRTPQQEGTEAIQVSSSASSSNSSKGKKAGATASAAVSVKLDVAWIKEHAEQVSRSLPGGLSVLGLFLICPESGLLSAMEAIKTGPGPLLLHVDSPSGKLTMKVNEGGAFKPCELKFSSSTSSLIQLTCSHTINITLPVEALVEGQASKQSFHEIIVAAVKGESDRIEASVAISSSHQVLPNDQPLIEVLANDPSSSQGLLQTFEVLLASPAFAVPGPGLINLQQSSTEGLCHLLGTISGIALVHNRELVSKAVSELKSDLSKSLSMRLELMIEDALSWEEENQSQGQDPAGHVKHPLMEKRGEGSRWSGHSFVLPVRVKVPLNVNGTTLPLMDYLMQGEGLDDVVERSKEILDLQVEEGGLRVMEERTARAKPRTTQQMPHLPPSSESLPMQEVKLSKGLTMPAMLIALGILFLALAIGSLNSSR